LHSENIKKLQNNTNAKIKELQNTSQKLKDEYEKKLSNSNAKRGETQGETEKLLAQASETQNKMQEDLDALTDLLKQSWPILSETLSNTEIGQALK
jgi:glutaredoxin 2